MKNVEIVFRTSPNRSDTESFIKRTYAKAYGAKITQFPERLISIRDRAGDLLCAAGLRFADEGFFSESYLGEPIDHLLNALDSRPVQRHEIFEVSTLASRSPRNIAAFIDAIVRYGQRNRCNWAFFTLTRRLHLLVRRIGLNPIFLCEADQLRIDHSESWGRYYAEQPKVFAVASPCPFLSARCAVWRDAHAVSL